MRGAFLSQAVLLTVAAIFCPQASLGLGNAPALVPAPKEVQWHSAPPIELKDGTVAIVIGEKASEPAKAAADLLQRRVAKRYGQQWPIVVREADAKKYGVVALLGERDTNAWLDRLCTERKIDLSDASPGFDGYHIDVSSAEGRTVAFVGGANARGTLYAQDTLYQLLAKEDGKLWLRPATIRDWPTVPWRGRPQTSVAAHLQPGMMDVYAISRVNFIDLRNGTYAFEADYQLTDKDKAEIAEVIKLARQRGIVVFGTINCAVPRAKHDAVMAQFKQFLSLGVDALWPSFDDKGPGEAPEELIAKVLELGKEHGITGSRIAITPPKGSYQTIRVPFNEKIMKVAGMEQAMWFWTVVPTDDELAAAKAIGLKTRLSWWHNWPRPESGFTHVEGGSLLGAGKRAYLEIPSMAVGWHQPDYDYLAPTGKNLLAVMPWGGNAWEPYYIVPVINWWGWAPENPQWPAVRARIYDTVFGPSAVPAATEFDDLLAQAKSLFVFGAKPSEWRPFAPPRLKSLADREKARTLAARMAESLALIEKHTPIETMLEKDHLAKALLEPMRAETQIAGIAAGLDYPEYWWDAHQRKLLEAVHAGDMARADELAASVRDRVTQEVGRAGEVIKLLHGASAYPAWWNRRAALNGAGWRDLLASRQAVLPKLADEYGYFSVKISDLLKNLPYPPYWWGRGKSDRQLHLLATAMPTVREQFRGDWIGGLYGKGKPIAALFAITRDSACHAGDYCELPVTVPVSGPRDRLGLLIYMNRHTKDAYGLETTAGRWAWFATVELLWGDRVLWQGDVGLPRNGCEWDMVRLPVIPQDVSELPLRLRVIDRKDSSGMQAIIFVGPILLVELPA